MLTARRTSLSALIAISLLLSGCTDPALTTAAKALQDVAVTNGALEKSLIDLNAADNSITEKIRPVLDICYSIDQATSQASAITRKLVKLGPGDQASLIAIFQPIVDQIKQALVSGAVVNMTDADLKNKIVGALTAIQLSLATAKIVSQS